MRRKVRLYRVRGLPKHLVFALLLGAMLSWTAPCSALDLALEDCVRMAVERDLRLVSSRNDVLESKHREWDAKVDLMPRIDVDLRRLNTGDYGLGVAGDVTSITDAWADYQQTGDLQQLSDDFWDYISRELFAARSDDPDYTDYMATVGATWPIYTGGRLTTTLKLERLNTQMAKLNLHSSALQVVYDVTTSFYNALAVEENLEISRQAVEQAQRYLDQFQKGKEVGATTHVDIINAEALLQQEQARLVGAEGALQASLSALRNLLGLPQDKKLSLEGGLVSLQEMDPTQLDCDQLMMEAQFKRPECLLNSMGVEAARLGVELVRSARRPTLTLAGSYSETWNNSFGGEYVRDLWDVRAIMTMGLWGDSSIKSEIDEARLRFGSDRNEDSRTERSVSVSLFDGSSMRSSLFEAENAFEEARSGEIEFRRALSTEVLTATSRLKEAFFSAKAAMKGIEAAETNLRKSELEYSLGMTTSTGVLEDNSELTGSRVALSTALFDLSVAKAELAKVTGRLPNYALEVLEGIWTQ